MTFTKINRYEIKNQLGAGGMATVFHAYDPSFERDVAIKVLPEAMLLDPQFRARFTREAKAIARLEHPAIVPVYDVGEENNQPYIVMRLMAGGSLADRIISGPISLEESAQIINRLAPALDAAHSKGIIHRDLKPANVLFDNYGNSYLSDFGIARVGQAEGTQLTGNFILGTPAYMSPEQARGESNLDGRSDIYSLGATLFEMLSGRIPYESDTPMGQALKHIMEPTPNILEIKPNLPFDVQDVIAKAMDKDRNKRYPTTAEMAKALLAVAERGEGETSGGEVIEKIAGTEIASQPRDFNLPATELAQIEEKASPAVPATQFEEKKKGPNYLVFGVVGVIAIILLLVGGFFLRPMFTGSSQAISNSQEATLTSQALLLSESLPTNTQAPEPTATDTPEPTPIPDTPTPTEQILEQPTDTPEPEIISMPLQGAADRIVYLIDNNIWSMNTDGSDPIQVTQDGTEKYALKFTPDGQNLYYISGKCLRSVNIDTKEINDIACYKYAKYFADFDVSQDGSKLALSLNNQLFIIPHDPAILEEAITNAKLTEIAECKDFAPYERNAVTGVEWSKDGNTLAIKIMGILNDGRRGDLIQIIPVDTCIPNPRPLDIFPEPRFDIPEYKDIPTIHNFSWDGVGIFAITTIVRNRVFGNMYFYNSAIRQGWLANPINNSCCYNSPVWSPDGNYLFFVYQDFSLGQTATNDVYYISYSDIEAKGQFSPIDSPPITNLRMDIEGALRPANR